MNKQLTFSQITSEQKLPAVVIDHNSFITKVNAAFVTEYGWQEDELLGKSVTTIIPPYLRDAHQIGFSRFMVTKQATLLGKSLPLSILYKDGTVKEAIHYIVGSENNNTWQFAATIVPGV